MNDQSQVQYGPFVLSFGDFLRQVNRARKIYRLTSDEYVILLCFVNTMPRPRYKNAVGAFVCRQSEYWCEETGLIKTNVFRAFRGLISKHVLMSIGKQGQKLTYFFDPIFENQVGKQTFSVHSPVNKSKNCDQSDHSTVINPISDCDQSDHSALYIEDSLVFPKDSLPFPSSIPAVDNGDKFKARTERLLGCNGEDAKKFLTRIKPSMHDRYVEFLDFADRKGWQALASRDAGVLWAKFFYHELPGQLTTEDEQALVALN